MRCVLATAILLIACPDPDSNLTRYKIDGLPVVIEAGAGPDEDEMRLALEVFRREVQSEFVLSRRVEATAWQELVEIRWVEGLVFDGGTYDIETQTIRLQWFGCVVEGPLYQRLMEHYLYALTEQTDHLGIQEWVENLRWRTAMVLCVEAKAGMRVLW